MTEITKLITDKDPDLKKAVEEKYKNDNEKNKNMHSSTTSYFLPEMENRILECMFHYCIENEYITFKEVEGEKCYYAVLCFDGFMLLDENYNKNILTELNQLIKTV